MLNYGVIPINPMISPTASEIANKLESKLDISTNLGPSSVSKSS